MALTSAQRRSVRERADGCCEYCRLKETDETSPFHVDHILPIKHGGTDDAENLGWACYLCNAFKGSNMAAADPQTRQATFLFNPRTQQWRDHFHLQSNARIEGIMPEGRVTVGMMRINDEARVKYRVLAMSIGEYPC